MRQLAAALSALLIPIGAVKSSIKEGASKLAHAKGFATVKNYAALGLSPALPVFSRKSKNENTGAWRDRKIAA